MEEQGKGVLETSCVSSDAQRHHPDVMCGRACRSDAREARNLRLREATREVRNLKGDLRRPEASGKKERLEGETP